MINEQVYYSSVNGKIPYDQSFLSLEKALFWSSKNETHPSQYKKRENKKAWFSCECGHDSEMRLSDVARGNWCSYCSHHKLCNDECIFCHENSFASHPKANCWSANNILTPRQVFKSTRNKYEFKCDKCSHLFKATLYHVSSGSWCQYCSHSKLCDNLDCNMCLKNSLAGHEKGQYLVTENGLNARFIFLSANIKYDFKCPHCFGIYNMKVNHATGSNAGCSCTFTKTETKLFDHLVSIFPALQIEKQKKFDWCKNKSHLPFDYCIESLKIIIELDGIQHFKQVKTWNTPEVTQATDKYKMECVLSHNYSVIRIFQENVWKNRHNWETKLYDAIKMVSNVKNPMIVFIGKIYEPLYLKMDGVVYM
jgi:very-short-patch-repair endonuclease